MRLQFQLLLAIPLVGILVLACGQADSPAPVEPSDRSIEIRITDVTPRFLNFYDLATTEDVDADRRWQLWQEHYNFAALPPVPERDSLARNLLDEAWDRYPEVIDRIRSGVAGMQPAPEPLFEAVAELFEFDAPITLSLIVYVGALEQNAFYFVNHEGIPTVAMPIEEDPDWRTLTFVHEFTHVMHAQVAGLENGWERPTAQTIFTEGLAMHAEEALFPELAPNKDNRELLATAAGKREEILQGILPYLRIDDSETVMRFTMGEGTTGTRREAYYVGHLVVGYLLEQGLTFPQLARVPDSEMPERVEQAIRELIH